MNRLPPLRALQVFEAVGRYGSMSEAARRLNVSSGAISQQMKILEDALGMRLVTRRGNRLELTPPGKRYYESCAGAFDSLRVAQQELRRVKDEQHLSISALPSVMMKWLAPRIFEWQQQHPGLNVFFDGSEAEPFPHAYDIDFRVTYGDLVDRDDNATELFVDCVLPACSPALLTGKQPVARPADLLAYPLLSVDWVPKYALPPSWSDWFAEHGVDPAAAEADRRVFSLSGMAIAAAVEGHGFVLAQYSMIMDELASGALVVPLPRALPLATPYFLKWRANAFDKEPCRRFHRWIVAQGRQQSARTAAILQGA